MQHIGHRISLSPIITGQLEIDLRDWDLSLEVDRISRPNRFFLFLIPKLNRPGFAARHPQRHEISERDHLAIDRIICPDIVP